MPKPELRDLIQNELRRVLIQNHPNFADWYDSLESHGQQVIKSILAEDTTPELIHYAQESPDDEWEEFAFIRMVGGGNPNPAVSSALTNFVLGEILDQVRGFRNVQN